MTMLDDEVLGTLLHETGDSFSVPEAGAADILRRIHDGDDAGAPPKTRTVDAPISRRWAGAVRSHRALSIAATLIVLSIVALSVTLTGAHGGGGSHGPSQGAVKAPHAASSSAGRTAKVGSVHGLAQRASASSKSATVGGLGLEAPAATSGTPAAGTGSTASGQSASTTPALPQGDVGQSARIEQTGSLDLTVVRDELSTTVTKLTSLATEYDGFVANSQTQSGSSGGPPSATVTLQVPVASFTAALADARALGKTSQLTTKATDVTGQYVDLQDQITALEASRQQYLTIMTKASSIGDVLAVQAQLDTLNSQIQQLQGQLQVLSSETAYSTLTVTASEAGAAHHRPAPAHSSSLARAWHDSVHGFIVGAEGVVKVAGPVLFALLCLAALLIGGRLGWRRLQRHNL